jgi:hypothetical protein
MAAYDYDYLGDLLKKVGGLMTQYILGNGYEIDHDNYVGVFGTMTRSGSEITSTLSLPNKIVAVPSVTIHKVGAYYGYSSSEAGGRAIYAEAGLSDVWAYEANMNSVSVITFTR